MTINGTRVEEHVENGGVGELAQLGYAGQSDGLEALVDASAIAVQLVMPRDRYELDAAVQPVLLDVRAQMRVDDEGAEIAKIVDALDERAKLEIAALADAVHHEAHVIHAVEFVGLDFVARDHVVEAALDYSRASRITRHQVAQLVDRIRRLRVVKHHRRRMKHERLFHANRRLTIDRCH